MNSHAFAEKLGATMRLYVTHTHTTEMKVSGSQSNNSSNLVWLVDEDKVDALSRGEDVEAKAWLSETVGEIVAIQHISNRSSTSSLAWIMSI